MKRSKVWIFPVYCGPPDPFDLQLFCVFIAINIILELINTISLTMAIECEKDKLTLHFAIP